MKNVLFLFLMLGFLSTTIAQISQPGTPASRAFGMPAVQTSINLTPTHFNWQQIEAEDALQAAQNLPMRAGFSLDVNKNIDNSGEWTLLPNGKMMWRIKLEAGGALGLGLVFDNFYIPEGAELYVYNADQSIELGAFTSENNNPSGMFSTALIPGTEIIVEYIETPEFGVINQMRKQGAVFKDGSILAPKMGEQVLSGSYHAKGVLNISQIIYNYKNPSFEENGSKDLGDSESCQVNINCSPEGDAWQTQKRGVARILFKEGSSWYYCTGTLVNNTAQNATPYFLTAYHCGAVASAADHSVWQFYFNYERSGCANTGTPVTNMITGCTKRAEGDINGGTDMQLVELSSTPIAAWNVYYNGWDRSGTASPSGVAIHHPSGDAKKISTYSTTLTNGTWSDGTNTGMTNGHWRVTWAATTNGHGVSEGGSSGSPIFNNNKLVVGTLSGGSSTCASPTSQDLYGKFSIHWEGNGTTNAYKLRPWLDPLGTNPTTLGGLDPNANTNPPVCDFVADRVSVVAGETVNFTDQSTNVPTSWAWTFTGAVPSTSTMRNPSCVWSVPGTYTVSLTATNAYGSNTKTRTAYITVTAYTTSTTNPVIVGSGTSSATYPLGVVRGFERSASIYTAAEIGRSGFLDSLSWYPTTARTAYRPLRIFVKHTTATTLTATTWASMISGATLIYDDSTTVSTANIWQAFPLKLNNFYYNGTDNLLVLVEQNKGANSTQTTACRYSTATSKHQYWRNAVTPIEAPTGNGTVENNRPNIRLRFKTFTTPVAQFTAGDGTVIMSENFDGTWLPTNWTVVNTHASKNWGQGNPSGTTYNTIDAGNVYSAVVPWIAEAQDEWLISPQVNTAAYAGRPLKIKFHIGFGRSYLSPGATLKFKVSTNNGTSWTDLWNAIGDVTAPTGTEWAWRLLNIDLSSYAGQNLKFAWEYVGNDGDMMAIDGVKLYIDEIPTQVNIFEGDYLQYTDLTTGNPMVWEYTLPGAVTTSSNLQNPKPQYNVAGTYNATLKAGNPKGEDTEAKTNFVVVSGRPPMADFWGLGNLTTITYQAFNPPGATVDYYDFSTRVPTSWEWLFESGTPATSTAQNPSGVTYSTTGTFDATLRAHNAHGHDTTTWTDFVAVGGTKFVTNTFPWDDLTVYGMTSGFVPGHNNYSMNKYAEFFNNDYPGTITKVRMPIYKAQGTGKTINIVVWDGSTGTPGTVLGTQTFPITDFTEGRYDTATFTTPVAVTGDFFVGYEISYDASHNYTTHMFCPYMTVDRGAGQPTTAYVMYSSAWYLIDELFGGLASAIVIEPEFTYDGAALPVVTATATPGCATGTVTITSNISANQTFYLLDNAGATLQTWTGNTNTHDFTGLANGTYKGKTVNGAVTSAESAAVTLTNDPSSVGGSVSGTSSQICFGSATGTLTASAYTGAITKWQKSNNGGSTWTDITNTSATYSETPSAAGTWLYRAVVKSGSCAEANSSSYTITVDPTTVAGSVSGTSSSLCIGTSTGTLTLSGHTGSVVKWQKRVDAGTWVDISNTSATYSETPSSAGIWEYRAVVQSGTCLVANSAAYSITVNAASVGGTVNGSTTTICFGSATGNLTLSGYTGSVIKWQKSNNGGSTWSDISNTTATFSETPSAAGTWLYRAVVQNGVCSSANSSNYSITVDAATVAGSVSGTNSQICVGTSTGTLTLSGHTGTIIKWQKSNNGGSSWTDITNTAATYSETPGTAGTWLYRAVVQSGTCTSLNSASFAITVDPSSVAGTTSGSNSEICLGSSTGTITLSGYTGAITKWQKSNNGGSTWTDITNTSATYSETPASAGTWIYRAVVQSGVCSAANSSSYSITVSPASVGGTVSGTNASICLGNSTGTLTLSGNTGNIVKWQKSNNGGSTWSDIANTTTTYSETPASAGTWLYRAVIQSGSCSVANASSYSITVSPVSNAGTLTATTTEICSGTSTGTITLSGYTGTITKWERSDDGGTTWMNLGNTNATYSEIPGVPGTRKYRVTVQSSPCSEAVSNIVTIIVDATTAGGNVSGSNSEICLGSNTGTLTLNSYTGAITKWQKSNNGGSSWIDITNTTSTYSETPATSGTWLYRAVVQSGVCSSANSSNFSLTVSPTSVGGSVNGTNAEICLGSNTGTMTLSGHTGLITKWQKSNNGGSSWTDISNTATTYSETPATSGTWIFRAVVQSGSCSSANSNSFSTIVNPTSVGGSITAGVTQIFLGNSTGNINLSGNTGAIVRWEKRLNSGSWTAIASTANPYSEIPSAAGFWDYRAVIQSGNCTETYSNSIQIEVLASSGGSVSGGTSPICLGSSTGTMTLSGHTGTIIRWQKSNDGGSTWTNISNTLTTYSETPATAGTWLYRVELFTTVTVYSAPQTIIVNPTTVAGSVSGGTGICLGSGTGTLTLSGHTGSILKWQVSTDGGTSWNDITNTATTYSTTPGSVGTYLYRAVVQSGSCSILNSNSTSVTVSPVTVAGSVTGGTTICAGSSTGTLTLSGHTGTIIKWQKQFNAGGWNDIANTSSTYSELLPTAGVYEYRAVIQSGACSQLSSTSTTVTVDAATVGGSVNGSNSNICLGESTGTMTLSGNTGLILKWQKSNNGGSSWTDITNTSNTYSETPILAGTWMYRAEVDNGTCNAQYSSSFTVNVGAISIGGNVSGDNTICAGTSTGTMTLSGYSGSIVKWQRSDNGGGTWTDITNTNNSYSEVLSSAGTYLYRAVVQNGICASATSTTATITVDAQTVAGTLSGTNSSICFGESTGNMTISGNVGSIVEWQKSNDGVLWTSIAHTSTSYSEIPSTSGSWQYRALVLNGSCMTSLTNALTIQVSSPSNGGTLSGNATICAGNNTGTMTLSGHNGNIIKWQVSNDGGSNWSDISNTATTYSENIAVAGTYIYRAIVQNGTCSAANSSTATIVVDPATAAGSVSGTNSVICFNSSTGTLTLAGHAGSIIKWQKRLNSGSWQDITTTSSTYAEIPSTAGTWEYRAEIQSGSCGSVFSGSYTITVDETSIGGTISGNTSACVNTSSGTLTLSGNNGTVIKWQKRFNSGAWQDITNNSLTHSEILTSSGVYEFRAEVANGTCSSVFSGIASINVDESSIAATITPNTGNLCAGSVSPTFTASGNNGVIVKWQKQIDGGGWSDIANTSNTHSETLPAQGVYEFRVITRNGACDEISSNIASITVSEGSVAGTITGGGETCNNGNFTLTLAGNTGTILDWEEYNGSAWASIGNTSANYNFVSSTAGVYKFRAVVQNGSCPSVYSNEEIVTIYEATQGGMIVNMTDSICVNENSGNFILTAYVGTILKWQKRVDGGAWTDIAFTDYTYSEIPSSAGLYEYRAVVKNEICNEEYSDIKALKVLNTPTASFTTNVDALDVIFTNTSTNATSYHWDFGDGQSSILTNPSHSYTNGGTYTVILEASNGQCSASYQEIVDVSVSIAEFSNGSSVLAYPNPSNGKFFLTIQSGKLSNVVLNTYDAAGKLINTTMIGSMSGSSTVKIEIPSLTAGVYHMVLTANEGSADYRMIVE